MIDENKKNVERVKHVLNLHDVFDDKSFDEVVRALQDSYNRTAFSKEYKIEKIRFSTIMYDGYSDIEEVAIIGYGPETDEEQETRIRRQRQFEERQQKKLKLKEEHEQKEYERLKAKFG